MQTERGGFMLVEKDWCCFNQPFLVDEVSDSEIKKIGFNEMFALSTIEKVDKKKLYDARILLSDKLLNCLSLEELQQYENIKKGSFGNLIERSKMLLSFDKNGIFKCFVLKAKIITELPVEAFGVVFIIKIKRS